MKKKEIIWRYILNEALEKEKITFQQKGIAQNYGFSLSTVFNALKIPRQIGAIEVTGRNFRVVDAEKFLYAWATNRELGKEIIYKTHTDGTVKDTEGRMPPGIIYGAYSAYVKKYNEAPADYDKVYIYAGDDELAEIKSRFPKIKGYENLFVIRKDIFFKDFDKGITPDVQTFADLWNLGDWYAKEFLNALKNKLFH